MVLAEDETKIIIFMSCSINDGFDYFLSKCALTIVEQNKFEMVG